MPNPVRHEPFGHMDFVLRMMALGLVMSPLFSAPGLTIECCKFDFMHAADLGVCCDFLGNLFFHLAKHKYAGATKASRYTKLFLDIRKWYKDNGVQNRLPCLTPLMVRKKERAPPKLRAKAAEARGLVGFALHIAQEKLDSGDVFENAIIEAARRLSRVYDCLSAANWDPATFSRAVQEFALLYVALEAQSPEPLWRVKPKLHPFLELARLAVNPAAHWTYRDEDFGGTVAILARRRGGKYDPRAVAACMLTKFTAQHEIPRF